MQTIKIDFDNPGLPQRLDVVENDAQSRFFKAVLYKDGKAYAAPSGATYSIMYRGFGPQNEGWYDTINDGAGKRSACSVSGNVVTCEIAHQALRVPGHVSVVLCVTGSNGYMLHGWPIDCNCRNDNYTGGTLVESFFYITQITNADWTSAIKTWEELKNMIDPTLSLSGKAADAAKVGEAVGQIKEDLGGLSVETLNTIKFGKVEKGNATKAQDIPVEPSTKYVIVMNNAENDGVVKIRSRKSDKSYISDNDYNLTANTPLKVEFTTTKDTYYLRIGGPGSATNYNIIIYKYDDSLARESDLKDITKEIKELKNQGVDKEIELIKQSILYGDVLQYLNFVKGSYSNPSSDYLPNIHYNACVKVYLKAGSKLKILNNEYYIKYNLSSLLSWIEWTNTEWTNEDTTIQSDGEYVIVAKKEPSGDFSEAAQLKTLNDSICAIVKGYTIKDKSITKEMLGFEIRNSGSDFIDVVKDKSICNDNSTDITNDIQSLLNVANTNGFVSLYFPKGRYMISSTLYYYGKTKLLFAKDAVVNVNTKAGAILSNANRASTGNNYNLGSLEIDGGTFKRPYTSSDVTGRRSSGLQCCQLELLSVKNCTFVDCCSGNHLIDISGCKEVIIENNIFNGMHLPSVIRPTREAYYSYITDDGTTIYTDLEMIQIDHGTGLGLGTIQTPTKNIKIINNAFMPNEENINSVIYRPIGSHTVSNLGYYRNIEISGNKFVNPFGRVISISKAIGVKICDNEFINDSQNVICDIVRMSLNVGGNNDSKNIKVTGNSVNYSVDTNNYKFFKVESNGASKVINGIVKWNDVGNFTNDYTNCENVEHD